MNRKVKTRKESRYQPRMVSPVRAKPVILDKESLAPEPKRELFVAPPRPNNQASSLQSTYAYVISDLKQVAIITVLLSVLLIITYLIMK